MEAVASKKSVVGKPDGEKHNKANGERYESGDRFVQVAVVLRNHKGEYKKDERKAEDDIAEDVDARHSGAANAKAEFHGKFVGGVHANFSKRASSQS
jgi:hypothetical protein